MSTRRQLLAGLGTLGAAGLAGCSALPLGGNETFNQVTVPVDAAQSYERPPYPFPVALPSSLATRHRERARELLDDVPADLAIPNSAVAEKLAAKRQQVADEVAEGTAETRPIDVVDERRHERGNAAKVWAAYRAAIGEADPSAVGDRLRTVRSELGSFWGDLAYRAGDPLEAVLVYAPIEGLLVDSRRGVHQGPAYPTDPVAKPFEAGDAVRDIETAVAEVDDAKRFRAAFLATAGTQLPQWSAVSAIVAHLDRDVEQTVGSIEHFFELETDDIFEKDLADTIAESLYEETFLRCRGSNRSFEGAKDDGRYATAVIEAGRTIAFVEALRTAIDDIRDGGYQEQPSVESVRRLAAQARSNLQTIEDSEPYGLAVRIGHPAIREYRDAVWTLEQQHDYLGADYFGSEFAWIELYTRAVPAATEFVVDRLDGES